MKSFGLSILTPEGAAYSGGVVYVDVPAHDGRMGVLADHAALIAGLARGELRARTEAGADLAWSIEGGFLQVFRNEAVVLTPGAHSR